MDISFAEKYLEKVPIRRMATVDDIANMVCFLGSDASSYTLPGGKISQLTVGIVLYDRNTKVAYL